MEDARRDGTIEFPDGTRLGVTNLAKIFWPTSKLTKGDLLRYYAEVSAFMLPAVADRPLVMKRFPNGVAGMAFYQQRKRLEQPPPGVRIETIAGGIDPILEGDEQRFVGGSPITLLYMTQIAAISQDPWFSRVQSPLEADYAAIDLDPDDHTPFSQVLEVARWVHDELEKLGVPAVPKTSGSSGLHIYVPLPPETSCESGQLFCQIVATVVASRHPKAATVERMVRKRRRGTVYVDFLQNILGKTLATAYSARASEFAGVSTPLTWDEVHAGVNPQDFTITTAPARFREVGDLWARLRTSKPANLETVFRKYREGGARGSPSFLLTFVVQILGSSNSSVSGGASSISSARPRVVLAIHVTRLVLVLPAYASAGHECSLSILRERANGVPRLGYHRRDAEAEGSVA